MLVFLIACVASVPLGFFALQSCPQPNFRVAKTQAKGFFFFFSLAIERLQLDVEVKCLACACGLRNKIVASLLCCFRMRLFPSGHVQTCDSSILGSWTRR